MIVFGFLVTGIIFVVQSRLQQKMQALQEENRALREALKHGPSAVQLEKAHKQIGQALHEGRY